MPSYTKYFDTVTYHPKFFLGDRVRGMYNSVPFSGTVAVDHRPYVDKPASVKVMLDLPIKYNEVALTIISVSHEHVWAIDDSV